MLPNLADLGRLNALKDSPLLDGPDPAFDRLAVFAAKVLRVPVALITLVDDHRQVFKSQCGLPAAVALAGQTPLSYSLCQYAVSSSAPFVVNDARKNPVVMDNLAVTELGLTAYLGVPLITPEGHTLGTLCAIDFLPREWNTDDIEILESLATQIMTEIQLRVASRKLGETIAALKVQGQDRESTVRHTVHDLRTPLASLVMGLELIPLMGELNGKQKRFLSAAQTAGESLRQMVTTLLNDEAGVPLNVSVPVFCDVAALVRCAVDQVTALAEIKGITLTIKVPGNLPGLKGDDTQITRVMVNLLGNAIKFTSSGGHVTVTVSEPEDANHTSVMFAVSDTGIGIASDNLTQIFKEGFRCDESFNETPSNGLGLASCRRIITEHGGRIWAESTPLLGSRFYFTLPVAK